MNNIVDISQYRKDDSIDVAALTRNSRKLAAGLIAPADCEVEDVTVANHTSEPIKDMQDIMKISRYLIQNNRWRDNMLFIVGINFGLRVSDLRMLRFCDLINENLTFKDTFPVFETKTRNTRKVKRNRYITVNTAVVEAVTLFLENTDNVKLSDYMFQSESNNSKGSGQPISRNAVYNMLTKVTSELGITVKVSTHTLRKTFSFHQLAMSNNDPRKLLLLSKMLGHSSVAMTMDYIGITSDEIADAYRNLNLGSVAYNYLNSSIVERLA